MQSDTGIMLRPAEMAESRRIADMSRLQVEYGLAWRWTPARIRQQIGDPDTVVLVATAAGEIQGFAIMRFGEQQAHLLLLAVEVKFRQQGIGSKLLAWLQKSAVTAGLQSIRAEVRASNIAARRFYEALGYRAAQTLHRYYDNHEAAVLMLKNLALPAPR